MVQKLAALVGDGELDASHLILPQAGGVAADRLDDTELDRCVGLDRHRTERTRREPSRLLLGCACAAEQRQGTDQHGHEK
jgi:hypothetical protein